MPKTSKLNTSPKLLEHITNHNYHFDLTRPKLIFKQHPVSMLNVSKTFRTNFTQF